MNKEQRKQGFSYTSETVGTCHCSSNQSTCSHALVSRFISRLSSTISKCILSSKSLTFILPLRTLAGLLWWQNKCFYCKQCLHVNKVPPTTLLGWKTSCSIQTIQTCCGQKQRWKWWLLQPNAVLCGLTDHLSYHCYGT